MKLYGGNVTMHFDKAAHMYTVDGIIVPSVSTVIGVMDKPALLNWAVSVSLDHVQDNWMPHATYTQEEIESIISDAKGARTRISGKAMNIGSIAHDWVERHIKNQIAGNDDPVRKLPDNEAARMSVESFLEWENSQEDLRYILSERKLYSKSLRYSGTVDIVMKIGDEVIVADLKTSKRIYETHFVQCAAYAHALKEETGIAADKIMVLRIPKDGGKFDVQESTKIDYLMTVFKACLVIWRWKNNWSQDSDDWQSST